MAILVFQHSALNGVARVGAVLRDHGHRLRILKLHEGDALPPDLDDVDGILSLGGPMNVDEQDQHPWMAGELELIRQAHAAELPVVGICLGAQLIAHALGGEVAAMAQPELGWHNVRLAFPGTTDPVLAGIPWNSVQFHLHGQEVTKLPPGATPLSASQACKNQAFKVGLSTYAFQYHFEWSKAEINQVLEGKADWIASSGGSADTIRDQMERYYDAYRHLGDRLALNLATLLYPIDKRLRGRRGSVQTGPVKNWEPARS